MTLSISTTTARTHAIGLLNFTKSVSILKLLFFLSFFFLLRLRKLSQMDAPLIWSRYAGLSIYIYSNIHDLNYVEYDKSPPHT